MLSDPDYMSLLRKFYVKLADTAFRALVLGAALLLVAVLVRVRFYGDFEIPTKPAKPAALVTNAKLVAKSINRSTDTYQSYLEQDAARFGVSRSSLQTMSSVFKYQIDEQQKIMSVGDRIEVLGLVLSLTEEKIQDASRSHMVLSIANQGFKPMAYRIQTRPSSGARSCNKMSQVPHNAVALAAGGLVKRAECLFRQGMTLEINSVETIELPKLGFHYLSSVPPDALGLDDRTSAKHKRPTEAMPCELLQSASMRKAVLSGEIRWRDQADFFARHRCPTYSFPPSYKAFQRDGEQILPISEDDL